MPFFLTFLDHRLVQEAHSRLVHGLQIGQGSGKGARRLVSCRFPSPCCLLRPTRTSRRLLRPRAGPGFTHAPAFATELEPWEPRRAVQRGNFEPQAIPPPLFAPGTGCPSRPELGIDALHCPAERDKVVHSAPVHLLGEGSPPPRPQAHGLRARPPERPGSVQLRTWGASSVGWEKSRTDFCTDHSLPPARS